MDRNTGNRVALRVAGQYSPPADEKRVAAAGGGGNSLAVAQSPYLRETDVVSLADILTPCCIKVPLEADTKRGVIAELIDVLEADSSVVDRAAALEAVLDREKIGTTGIGSAVAIPHGKTAGVKGLVMAVGICKTPVDFHSVDHQPVMVVILLLSPMKMTAEAIQALDRILRLVSLESLRRNLAAAGSVEEVLRIITEQEADVI
jgi:PTS system nitrogen regulatory IIA component